MMKDEEDEGEETEKEGESIDRIRSKKKKTTAAIVQPAPRIQRISTVR